RRVLAPALEHAVKRLTLDPEHARGRRLVAVDGFEYASDVASLELLECDERRRIVDAEHEIVRAMRPHPLRYVTDRDLIEGRERHRALDAVLQLAHVAGPRIRHQLLSSLRREARDPLVRARSDLVEKVAGEHEDITTATAQRRQVDLEHVDTEIEIL